MALPLHPLLRLMRPHQYAKNLLVFSAPGAAGRLDEANVMGLSLAAFVLFCVVSSAGYVANDLLDAPADRLHPTKRDRPIASGAVQARTARLVLAALTVASIALSPALGWKFTLVLAGYAALTFSYSARLKHVPWLELLVVSGGFILRAVAGGAATDTPLSGWFLLVVSAGALLMITGKRLGELASLGPNTASRAVLAQYQTNNLRRTAALSSVLAVAGYVAWAAAKASDQASSSASSTVLRLTALPFAIAIARYAMLAWQGAGETPESLVVRDRLILLAGLTWIVLYSIGIYL